MSATTMQSAKVLMFRRVEKALPQVDTSVSELKELLGVYEQLIGLLRDTYDDGVDAFTDSLVLLLVRGREALAGGTEEFAARALLKEMRDELRHFPQTLRSLLPGIGPRLGESIQGKMGIQFARY